MMEEASLDAAISHSNGEKNGKITDLRESFETDALSGFQKTNVNLEISASLDPVISSSNGEKNGKITDLKEDVEYQKTSSSREIGDVGEQPTSLRLESVLEYTNKIKSFLGLQDEPDSNVPSDSTTVEDDVSKEKNSEHGFKDDISSAEESPLNEGSFQPDSAPPYNELNHPLHQPLPDIIGVPPDSFEEVEREKFPDILERYKNFDIDKPGDILTDFTTDVLKDGVLLNTDTNRELGDVNIATIDDQPLSKSVLEKVPVEKVENTSNKESENDVCQSQNNDSPSLPEAEPQEWDVPAAEQNVSVSQSQNNDSPSLPDAEPEEWDVPAAEQTVSVSQSQNNDIPSLPKAEPEEWDVPAAEQNISVSQSQNNDSPSSPEAELEECNVPAAKQNVSYESKKFQNEKDSGDENPYQIMDIEEGLRQAEKNLASTLPQKTDERQTMVHDGEKQDDSGDTNPFTRVKIRSKLSMEDIRRLSTEVVNTVLLTAGDEVKVILQNRDSTTEENKPPLDFESPDDEDMTLPLQDTEVEYHIDILQEGCLADIPEEESLRTFSNVTDNSSKTVTSSIAMKDIPVGSKHSIDRIEVTDEIDIDVQCGFGPFKPQCIQRYATANVYVILYSIIGILHGSYYTYLVGVLTTLEKRFEFKSKTSGFIMMLDELTPLFLGVLVGHFGGRAHRPRLLSFGMFLSAFCCFASALPYFLYGTATHLSSIGSVHNRTSTEMCNGDVRIEHCDEDDRPPTLTAILLLMLGSFLKGFGNLAYYAIGLAYLDDNAKKRNTPLYFAVAFALRLLGPMVGFLMSSAFLKYYENPFETPDFGPEDPRWIGGWWMGFVLQGVLLLIFAGPMALFPRRLPDHRPLLHEMEHNSKSMFDGLGDSLKRLARNPLYMLIGLNAIFTVYGNFGYYIMLPKYMENQFRLSASSASLFAGPPGIAALMCSCIIGGYLIWKFRPTAKFLAGGLVTLELISTAGYLILMIPKCDKIDMAQFGFSEEGLILENACNSNCSCSTVSFTPVCGPDGKSSYFSPCYAGCSSQQGQTFYNCSCVTGFEDAVVTKGMCSSEECWSRALAYIVTLPVLQFMVNILRVAYTMIMLRSINPEDKNIALGVFETVLSTVAFIPFPVLYGALVDSACLVWEKSCGETGNCWFYDIQKFNYLMHGGSAFFCALSTLNLVAIFFLVDRIKDLYKEEDDPAVD